MTGATNGHALSYRTPMPVPPVPQVPRVPRAANAVALLRMLTAIVVFFSAEVWRAPLLVPVAVCPTDVVQALRGVVLVAAALTLIGAKTRVSSTILALSLGALLWLVQRQGTPLHVHHLVWLAALVAAGPSGAAWSVDAWRLRRAPAPHEHDDAVWTLRFASLVLGLVYFFPGLHKVVDAGTPFFDAASLLRLVRLKAVEASSSVPLDVDQAPTLVLVGAWLVIVLELAAPFVALWRPRLAFFVVVALHGIFTVVLHMPYTVLSVFALVFLLFLLVPARLPPLRSLDRRRAVVVVGGVLVVGIIQAGLRSDMTSYPFACYPTFALPVPHTVDVVIVEVERDGRSEAVSGDVVIPDDMRSASTFAARQLRTAADAQRFLEQRCRDARLARALHGGSRVQVVRATRDLTQPGSPEVKRHALLEAPPPPACL